MWICGGCFFRHGKYPNILDDKALVDKLLAFFVGVSCVYPDFPEPLLNSYHSCRHLFGTVSILSLISVGIGNIMVLLRVVKLWDHRPVSFVFAVNVVGLSSFNCTLGGSQDDGWRLFDQLHGAGIHDGVFSSQLLA